MPDIYINGKYYHIAHKKLKENHNYNNKYDYVKNDIKEKDVCYVHYNCDVNETLIQYRKVVK